MRLLEIVLPAALVAAATPAMAQSGLPQPLPIATVTCSEIADVSPAYQAALIYYAAGYRQGVDYGLAVGGTVAASSAQPSGAAVASAPSSSAGSTSSASSNPAAPAPGSGDVVAGLTLQAQDIVTACRASPAALLTDIIVNHGGATGSGGTPGGIVSGPTSGAVVSNGSGDLPVNASGSTVTTGGAGTTTGSGTGTAGTNSTTNSGIGAVTNDLNNAGAQNQKNIATPPGTVPGATTTNPAAGGTTTGTGATGAGATSP